MYKCALIIYGSFTRSIRVSLFVMILMISFAPLRSSATPDQLWEDYVFAERPKEWVEQRPEGSIDRVFFEVLNAQSMGQLEYAAQLLDGVKNQSNLTWPLSSLKRLVSLASAAGDPAIAGISSSAVFFSGWRKCSSCMRTPRLGVAATASRFLSSSAK